MRIRKAGGYRTRHMVANVNEVLGRALIKLGKYEEADKPLPNPKPSNEIDQLRDEADRLGVHVDKRWGAARLRHEIAQARDLKN